MLAADSRESLSAARSDVRRACELLEGSSPQSLEASSSALRSAIAGLNGCRHDLRPCLPDAHLADTIREFRREVRNAGRLLESAADFYRGWERILGTMSGGYMAGGEPAPVTRPGKLSCQA